MVGNVRWSSGLYGADLLHLLPIIGFKKFVGHEKKTVSGCNIGNVYGYGCGQDPEEYR